METARARNAALDGLRAVALVRVMTWHATGWPVTTWIVASVPAMFVVTGFLLAQSATDTPTASVISSRLRRLYPPYLLYAATVLVVTRLDGSPRGPLVDFIIPLRTPRSDVASGWLTTQLWYLSAYLWILILAPLILSGVRRSAVATLSVLLAGLAWTSLAGVEPGTTGWIAADVLLYGSCTAAGMVLQQRDMPRRAVLLAVAGVSAAVAVAWSSWRPPLDSVVNNDHVLHLLVGASWTALLLTLPALLEWIAGFGPARIITRSSLTVYLWHSFVAWSAWIAMPSAVDETWRAAGALTVTLLAAPVIASILGPFENVATGRRPSSTRRVILALSPAPLIIATVAFGAVDLGATVTDQPLPPSAAPVVVPVPVDRTVTDFLRSRSPDDRSLPIAELQQLLERHNSRIGLGGLRAVVITADGRRWSGGTAEMDDDYERSAIGSLTKTFTTSIIMQEVARGTIKMDDPIGDLGIGFGKPQLTVRQLLTHTSGIAKVTENKALLEDGTPVEEVVLWAGRKPLDFSPGSRVKYSTTGFAVLGIHLENVTGRTFEDLVEERIAQPYGYDLEYFRSRYRSIGFATGGILINMDDLADWIRRYVRDRSTPGGLWAWDFRGTTGIGIHSYCPCEGRKSTALGHMGGRTFATVDADGTVVVIDSRGILVLENYESTQSLAQELRLLAGGGVKRLVP
ncbi:MAG: hypothetical protein EBT97_02205 [Actinobacteria bacterium]|nr:hypothetical protein [Actinomycetota bacterium]